MPRGRRTSEAHMTAMRSNSSTARVATIRSAWHDRSPGNAELAADGRGSSASHHQRRHGSARWKASFYGLVARAPLHGRQSHSALGTARSLPAMARPWSDLARDQTSAAATRWTRPLASQKLKTAASRGSRATARMRRHFFDREAEPLCSLYSTLTGEDISQKTSSSTRRDRQDGGARPEQTESISIDLPDFPGSRDTRSTPPAGRF